MTSRTSCHTPPNERFLQHNLYGALYYMRKLSYPSKREVSTTCNISDHYGPPRPLSYPSKREVSTTQIEERLRDELPGCHTPPNERFLQHCFCCFCCSCLKVVIPLQTRGFYNGTAHDERRRTRCCHTPPNERFLQLAIATMVMSSLTCCHTPPNERFLQRQIAAIVTDGKKSCHTPPNERFLQLDLSVGRRGCLKLSYPSKREVSTTHP